MPTIRKLPVTVISGFLGAGKTTLVNHLLQQYPDQRIGVIVNEFGEVGIDGQLIVADEETLIEINNGCVCCTVRVDLVASVKELLARTDASDAPIERLILETSGLADPAPVLQTFLADPEVRERVELESVVTVVDAHHVRDQLLDTQMPENIAREQIAFADVVIVNKVDLADERSLIGLHELIRDLNRTALIVKADHGRLPKDALLGVSRFSLPALLDIEPDLLDDGAHDHEHDESIQSCALIESGTLDPDRFNSWVNRLVQEQGQQLMRMKGVLHFRAEARQFHFHSVHMLLEARPGRPWGRDEIRDNRFVFIGRDLDMPRLRAGFRECMQAH